MTNNDSLHCQQYFRKEGFFFFSSEHDRRECAYIPWVLVLDLTNDRDQKNKLKFSSTIVKNIRKSEMLSSLFLTSSLGTLT